MNIKDFNKQKALEKGKITLDQCEDDPNVSVLFEDIDNAIEKLRSCDPGQIEQISNNVADLTMSLTNLWTTTGSIISPTVYVYLTNSMDSIIFQVCSQVLNNYDIINGDKSNLDDIFSFVHNYIEDVYQYTTPNSRTAKKWTAQPYVPGKIKVFERMLYKFNGLAKLLNDLGKMLDPEEQESLNFGAIVSSAAGLIPTKMLQFSQTTQEACYASFEIRLQQVEKCAAAKMHNDLVSSTASPEKLIQLFQNHTTLLSRDVACKELSQEISVTASFIVRKLQATKSEIDARSDDSFVEKIIWCQQRKSMIEGYIKFTNAVTAQYQNNQNGKRKESKFIQNILGLQSELKSVWETIRQFQDMQMKTWENSLNSRQFTTLKPTENGKLVTFDDYINVHFTDELNVFMKEYNDLKSFNIRMPSIAKKIYDEALPYQKAALIMSQVARTYSALDIEIPTYYLGMFKNVVEEFESTANKACQPNATSDPQLMHQVLIAQTNLTSLLSTLTQETDKIMQKIGGLSEVDLIDNRNVWIKTIRELRQSVSEIHSNGINHTEQWTEHIDNQIKNVLKYQFRNSILSIAERTAQIEVSLVFAENKVQLRPCLEDIRHIYYLSVSELLLFPKKLNGVANGPSFFSSVCSSAPSEIKYVFMKGESLIRKIYKYQFQFDEWSILAQYMPTMEERCESLISTAAEWKSNISLVSMRKESINEIPDSVTIGCFRIDNSQLKEGLRRLLSQFQTILIVSLRKTLKNEFDNVHKFVDSGLALVGGTFETAEEIAESRRKFEDLVRNKVETELTFTSLTEKVNLLKNFESIEEETKEFDKLLAEWRSLTEKMDTFDDTVASQFENVKNKMRSEFNTLKQEIRNFKLRWDEMKPKDVNMDNDDVVVTIPATLKQFADQGAELRARYEKLAKPLADFDENVQIDDLEEFEKEHKEQEDAIELLIDWRAKFTDIASQHWDVASQKLFLVEDFLNGWSSRLQQLDFASDSALYIDEKVKHYKSVYPFLKFVRGDDWQESHWVSFFHLVGINSSTNPRELTLGDFLEVGDMLQANIKAIKELAERARGENTIRTSLEEVRSWFSTTNFCWFDHTFAGRTTGIVKEWKQLLSDLADKQSLIGSLKDSPFIKAFQNDVIIWDQKAVALATSLRLLNEIQRRWLHLEPVFVKKALPEHTNAFEAVDGEFRTIMKQLRDAHRAAAAADLNEEQLEKILQRLDQLNRVLNVFLEQKRDKFSRFYFIGDEDLLEIIGQASEDATIIQAHLKKLFQGVQTVVFDETNKVIKSVVSALGETVDLIHPIKCEGNVEDWLMKLSDEIADTLKAILAEMVKAKPDKDYFKYPSQLTLLYHQIKFTALAEKKRDCKYLSKYVEENLMRLVGTECQDDLQRYAVRSLIIEFVRFRQVVEELEQPGKWSWQKQLRFYFRSGLCFAEMGDAVIPYGYEYQGNPARLVYTPLTAKCYLTLCEGIALGYGGNPYGPAGTGKTESVKALGQALGRQVLVFNCDEAIDVQSMCRIFTGLVMGGAWGCFDEFNRLDEEVLSALSQNIQIIQTAILNKEKKVDMLGRKISVNPNAGIYVTLNPAGKGYGGRSKLPSNLTALFRAVAMSAPDNELIAEVLMYSQGFHCARAVSKQIVLVFSLCKQLLSPEIHYDWGLRSLKSILSTAEQWMNNLEGDVDEPALLVKALRVGTLSKLTFADRIAFEQIIADVFPDVKIDKVEMFELRTAASEVIKEMGLVELTHQVEKMLQMWESINQRTGVVLTGPSGCGKTTLWTLLKRSLDKIGVKVDIEVMNPKSMPRQRLLGRVDYDTREWFDGVLTRAARRAVASSNRTWIVCDGDIDPEWIESLNSVLDDNRLLTLPNGERIQFDSRVNFVFESHSLEHASPATVSRMAVILLAPEDLTVQNVCMSWLSKWPSDSRVPFLMEQLFYRTIETLVARSNNFVIGATTFGITTTVLSHLNSIKGDSDAEFINALIRGAVPILPPSEQPQMASEIYKWSTQLGLMTTGLDPNNLIDQYWNGSGLQMFDFHPAPATLPPISASSLPLVSTTEVQRTIATIKPWIESGQPMMLVGPRGSGKCTILTHLFKLLPSTTVIVVNCSAKTDAASLMSKLMQQCTIASTAAGQVLRPRNTEKALVFFKNFDLPRPDKWGTVQLVSFMQQLLTHGGFYNEELQWIKIERIQFVFSMSSAEKRPISPRFTSIIRIAAMHETSPQQLQTIYSHYLNVILEKTSYGESAKVQSIAAAMVKVYQKFHQEFSVDEHPQYDFTYRDITRWVVQLQRYIHNSNTFNPTIIVYEGIRHFVDRIAQMQDRTRMAKEINNIFKDTLTMYEETDFEYCNYQIDTNDKPPLYLVQMEKNVARDAFKKLVVSYEREMGHLDVFRVPDTEFLAHRVSAALALPMSNIVSITLPGLSFNDILRIVSHSSGIEIHSPPQLADFSYASFMSFLKELIPKVTSKDEEVVLLIEDFMFVDNAILDAINSLMASGEVGGLFSQTEFDSLVASIQGELRDANSDLSPQEFYCEKVKRLIHVVIVLNPEHSAYKSYFSFAPSFVSDSIIMWSTELNNTSLAAIPRQILLSDTNTCEALNSDIVSKLTPMFVSAFNSIQEPPIKYSEFIRLYLGLFTQKQKKLAEKKGHLDIGLAKLNEAQNTVDTLSTEIAAKQTVLSGKEKDANDAMERIKKAVAECSSQQSKIEKMQGTLGEEEKKLQVEQRKIEDELGTIQPEIDAALEAVGKIRREQLAEVRALAKPPQAIIEVMTGVLMMLGENDSSWAFIKKTMGSDGFTGRIMKFDANKLTPDIISRVEKHIKAKAMYFEDATVRKASQAVAPLAQWVKANVRFFTVLEKVEPLRKQNEQYAAEINKKRAKVEELRNKKKHVDAKVEKYQEQFRITTKEAEQLKNEVRIAEQNLNDAQQLFSKLKDEKGRWEEQSKQIGASLSKLPKETMIAAAVAAFCGKYPEDERKKMIAQWMPVIGAKADESFSTGHFLYTESELMDLRGSLSGDALSLENAVIIANNSTVPLIIDPTAQSLGWLVSYFEKRGQTATVLPRGHERFSSELALAVRFGKILIISEIDSIDGILIPLIRKDLIFSGSRPAIRVGDREIDYNENFKLYLVTREPQPTIHPTAASHVCIVNFSVTRSGLESTLLSLTLEKEEPDVQEKRSKCIASQEEMKLQLSQLEVNLLKALVESDGEDILHNTALIETLNQTKEKAKQVAETLSQIESTSKVLEAKADTYRPLAKLGASLYFAIASLSHLDHMYRFSSSLFMHLFASIFAIKEAKSSNTMKFETELMKIVFRHVMNSMFNKHRPAAALHIVNSCYSSMVDSAQFDFLLSEAVAPGEAPKWVPENRVAAFMGFCKAMPELVQSLKMRAPEGASIWQDWVGKAHPEEAMPSINGQSISKCGVTPFTQLIIVSVLVPHRLVPAIQSFVTDALGLKQFSTPFEYNSLLEDKSGLNMIFIVSPGADPSQEVRDVAKRGKISLTEVAVGQEAPELTIEKIKKCAEEGSWFMLKNTHLSISLVSRLEKEIASLTNKKEGFRVFFTTEPHRSFPPLLLANSVKVAVEAPPGIRANLMRTVDSIGSSSPVNMGLIAATAYFHSIIQERRTYIPQGWTKFYEFSSADFSCALQIISHTSGSTPEDFEYIRGLLCLAVYGGRVDNDFDFEVLSLYLKEFLSGKKNPLHLNADVKLSDLQKAISKLPERDDPASFFLPPNATKTVALSQMRETIYCLRRLNAVTGGEGSISRAMWVEKLKPLAERWKDLVRRYPKMTEQRQTSPADETPMAAALYSQCCVIHQLVRTLVEFFKELDGFLNHGEALSHNLQSIGGVLIAGEVPDAWFDVAEGPQVPSEWLNEVARKVDAIDAFAADPKCVEKGIELGAVLRPTALLDALRQQTARETGTPMVDLRLVFSFGQQKERAIYATDLSLQGAVFQGLKIAPMVKDGPIVSKAPKAAFTWEAKPPAENVVKIPLYSNTNRERFIVSLPTECQDATGGRPASAVFAFAGAAFIIGDN